MIDLETEFRNYSRRVVDEKGDIDFMALVRRSDVLDSWDVVIAADWASANKGAAIDYLIDAFREVYGKEALLYVARFVVLNSDDNSVKEFTEEVFSNSGLMVQRGDFFGVETEKAVVVTTPAAFV